MSFSSEVRFTELYEVLGVAPDATKAEIRKAYHKAALAHHPDKVPEDQREEAEIKFKAVSEAYETLYDEDKRHNYDRFGPSNGAHPGMGGEGDIDLDDLLAQMFGMGGGPGFMPGMGGMPGMGRGPPPGRGPKRGKDDVQPYEVSLEDMYKGKTVRMSAKRNVLCKLCKGTGGKEKAKARECSTCKGKGWNHNIRQVSGMLMQETNKCTPCHGTGKVFREKDRCKKCKGDCVTEVQETLEIYIPRGSREGDKIVLAGKADEVPGMETGDIVLILNEKPHSVFTRDGNDLSTTIKITLEESLCGFDRVVLKHLDGRGIKVHLPKGKVIKPGQILKVSNEGMPKKRGEARGTLFLLVEVEYPDANWLSKEENISKIQSVLKGTATVESVSAETVDEVDYSIHEPQEEFEDDESHGRGADGWSTDDDDDDGDHGPQCAQQ